jgi:hypothetical protein
MDGRDAGFIEWYRLENDAEYLSAIRVSPRSFAIDLVLGEPELVHSGTARK